MEVNPKQRGRCKHCLVSKEHASSSFDLDLNDMHMLHLIDALVEPSEIASDLGQSDTIGVPIGPNNHERAILDSVSQLQGRQKTKQYGSASIKHKSLEHLNVFKKYYLFEDRKKNCLHSIIGFILGR